MRKASFGAGDKNEIKASFGFGRQGEKAMGVLTQKPLESLPKYSPGQAQKPAGARFSY